MRLQKAKAFTLIELLVVMAIIVILAGLILTLIPYIHQKQLRALAQGEIAHLSVALEHYKADNGIYPDDANVTAGQYTKGYTDNLDARTNNDPMNPVYINAGLVLYRALSGDRNLDGKLDSTGSTDTSLDLAGNALSTPVPPLPAPYFTFPDRMLVRAGGTGAITAIVDPFGNSYGYSTAYQGDVSAANVQVTATTATTPAHGYNPAIDLWSTGGTIGTASDSPVQTGAKREKWIINWQNSGANKGQ